MPSQILNLRSHCLRRNWLRQEYNRVLEGGASDRPSELPTATADPAAGYLGGGWAASRVSIRHAQRFIQRSGPKSAAVTVGEF